MLQDTAAAMACTAKGSAEGERIPRLTDTAALVATLDRATETWHTTPAMSSTGDLLLDLHASNFTLWHLEDSARDPAATAVGIAAIKHSIDRVNQRRNDSVEAIDAALLDVLGRTAVHTHTGAPLHSETPGQMLDRLSILSLKRYHTAEESRRTSATAPHRSRNAIRLVVLEEQSQDLALCLQQVWTEVERGERRFKLYRQFKMYNDPELNPVLYGSSKAQL